MESGPTQRSGICGSAAEYRRLSNYHSQEAPSDSWHRIGHGPINISLVALND